jgi:multidrug efflux pump subunit AcrA (membrane-fusion protein)
MKQTWRIIGLMLILSLSIISCSTGGTQSAATPAADQPAATTRSARISANGKVVPAQKTTLSFALPGQLIELRVEVGSTVKQGEVIARLDTSILDAEVARAQSAVAVAQASLDRIKAGPRAEQVVAAQSALSATTAIVQQTAANRDQVKEGPTAAEINSALAETQQAYIAMVAARTRKDVIQKDLDNHTASQDTADDAYKQYVVANQQYEAAQARQGKLLAGADANTLRAAQANLGAASADYQAQQAQVNLLLAGARPEDITVVETNLEQAQAAVQRAQTVRQQAELIAPFDGTISEVLIQQAQYVNAGTPIVLIADLSSLHIETTDLNEKDIAGITIGSKADVTFDALPDIKIEGTVTQIAPKSNKASGVNYTVSLDLAQLPDRLRWGMTALVEVRR